jgi:DNA processing protein
MTHTLVKTTEQKEFKHHPLLSRLLELHDIPKVLHIIGDLPKISIDEYGRATPRILTVVGSRKHSTYGRQALESLLASLKNENVIIVSGLALGIDGLAHKAALNNKLITIAIPGSGLDEKVLYPSSHTNLAKEIIEHNGALISELDSMTQAAPWTFPQRNRVMAALCDALLVVEAEEQSGTLITARLALELGRDIGAIPGEIFSPSAKGTNMLIKEGAYPITSPSDLFSLLHLREKDGDKETEMMKKEFQGNEKIIMDILLEPMNKDLLLEKSKLSFTDFLTTFSSLEIDGYLQESFGEVRRLV